MIAYSSAPKAYLSLPSGGAIASFIPAADKHSNTTNVDWQVVKSFGEEWKRFHTFKDEEIRRAGDEYFDIVPPEAFSNSTVALDVGCGSGRWTKYVSERVGFVEAVDPSEAVYSASELLVHRPNVRITQASADALPFPPASFDLVFSLGVLHHIPNTAEAVKACAAQVKPGGWFLLYLYYALDNRSALFRLIFQIVNSVRKLVSSFPQRPKVWVCDVLAVLLYMPSITLGRVLVSLSAKQLADKLPLAYYRDKSWYIIRNDALDRFGTQLEQRFTRQQIEAMLLQAGLVAPTFSEKAPFWHVIARKPL